MAWLIVGFLVGLLLQTSGAENFPLSQQFGGFSYADPDSIGYRQCAYWKLPDGTRLHSSCTPHTMERCGKKAEFMYQCCSGFEEDPKAFDSYHGQGVPKCAKMISPYNSCSDAAHQSTDIAGFSPQMASVNALQSGGSQEAYTIFAPNMGQELVNVEANDHVVKGRYYSSDLKDGMELETVGGRRKLYVTRYPYGAVSVDCSDLIDANLECLEGVMHKIRKPLNGDGRLKNADQSSVLKFLQSHPDTKAFADDLPSDVKQALGNVKSGRRYTVLAPRGQTWNTIKRQYDGPTLQRIAASHVLDNQICSSALIASTNFQRSVKGDRVTIACETKPGDPQEKRYVYSECKERHALVEEDMAAANGVIHMIDEPIIPLFARNVKELASNKQCANALKISEFLKLIEECDLKMDAGTKYAFIVPRDEAFVWWSTYEPFREEYQRFQTDPEYRCRVARYHIVKSYELLNSMDGFASHTQGHRSNNRNNYLYETTYFMKTRQGSQLHFHYSNVPEMRSLQVNDGSMYLTTKINVIPEKNISDILRERPDTKLTNQKTIDSDMENKHFRPNAPKNLYLVTTDDGWKDSRASATSVSPYVPEYTMYKGSVLEKYLLLYHIPFYLWGDDIGYFPKNSVHKFMSSAGVELTFWRDGNGVMRIGHDEMPRNEWPRVVKWNLHARDGMMWLLDGTLKCPPSVCPLYMEDIDIYDMYVSACQTAHLPNEPNAAKDFRKKPTDVASRHPNDCIVVLQLSEKSVNLVEAE